MQRAHFFTPALAAVVLVAAAFITIICAPDASARDVGVVLKPQNETQHQAVLLLVQGTQLLKAKEAFKSRPLLEQAAQLWPDCAHIHFNLGLCYSEIGDFPRAISEYKTALTLDRHLTEVIPNIGTCYQLMGQYDEAIAFFEGYLRKDPHAEDAAEVRGMIAALQRQASKQIDSDPQSDNYLPSILRNGRMERWQRERLPIKVFISNGTDEQGRYVPGFREDFNQYMVQAFDTWVKASDYKLAYEIIDDASKADIICTWTDQKDFLQEQSTSVEQGAARVQSRPLAAKPNESEIHKVRVIILLINPGSGQIIPDDEVKKTCLHELGHALGFAGHSTNNKDVMFFSESPTVWAALTKRDKNTMAKLYSDYPVMQARNGGAGGQQPYFQMPAATSQQPAYPQPYQQQPYQQQPYQQPYAQQPYQQQPYQQPYAQQPYQQQPYQQPYGQQSYPQSYTQ
jgi:tetratricopeptide (TPR) repeat protein